MMKIDENSPATIYLHDYRSPAFLVENIELDFDMHESATLVSSKIQFYLNPDREGRLEPLSLHGEALELLAVAIDGEPLVAGEYVMTDEGLEIPVVPNRFVLEVKTQIDPVHNTSLEGLYLSNGNFCTQCEAQGFRKITYYPDRPDVLARFRVRVEADQHYPVLLSNGNLVEQGRLGNDRHFAVWDDPFRKPSYLFALVAGDLVCLEDHYQTGSGRDVLLQIYVEARNQNYCEHAMRSLQQAMRWDEEVYGLEYDLDRYMIVAVDDFNMGAMENKGLNVFNSKYVLAHPDTATDSDYLGVESVIGHEYFHNWTGNRVTCRDWFQLSLKEGLTVFRDQQFSADLNSAAVKRIDDVRVLRQFQFPEDAGPMAHPVRPSSYVEINNFYTATVYNKGAEVIRMMATLLGRERFIAGVRLYLERHDGQAATCDDFVAAMEEAGKTDLSTFKRWYRQSGTPKIHFEQDYDSHARTFRLRVSQSCPATPGQPEKEPFLIPLAVGLLDESGNDLPLRLEGEFASGDGARVLELQESSQEYCFQDIPCRPVVSLLRGFSAPVQMTTVVDAEDLAFQLVHDSDPFNRWEAGQKLAVSELLRNYRELAPGRDFSLSPVFMEAWRSALADRSTDRSFLTQLLTLPSEQYLADQLDEFDPHQIHGVRMAAYRALVGANEDLLKERYAEAADQGSGYRLDPESVGRRALANFCLTQLLQLPSPEKIALGLVQYREARNMTGRLAAFTALINTDADEREELLDDFYRQWQAHPLLVDKWFSLQALAPREQTFAEVKRLLGHPKFNPANPNRVRSLLGAFAQNMLAFHQPDGSGYQLLRERILLLDQNNAQLSARLAGPFTRWQRLEPIRRQAMKKELEIMQKSRLSRDLYEIVSKSL